MSMAVMCAPAAVNISVNSPVPHPISRTRLEGPTSAPRRMSPARRLARSCPAGVPHPQTSSAVEAAKYLPCSNW